MTDLRDLDPFPPVDDPDPSWRQHANCAGVGPNLFHGDHGPTIKQAKAVCAGCPVAPQCLDFAVRNAITHGVWGGLSPKERRPVRRAWIVTEATTRRTHGKVATYRAGCRCGDCRDAHAAYHRDRYARNPARREYMRLYKQRKKGNAA